MNPPPTPRKPVRKPITSPATVSRTLQPQLPEFLYALSRSDGADPTIVADGNGTIDLDLPNLLPVDLNADGDTTDPGERTSPTRKDIFVEIDAMTSFVPEAGAGRPFEHPRLQCRHVKFNRTGRHVPA